MDAVKYQIFCLGIPWAPFWTGLGPSLALLGLPWAPVGYLLVASWTLWGGLERLCWALLCLNVCFEAYREGYGRDLGGYGKGLGLIFGTFFQHFSSYPYNFSMLRPPRCLAKPRLASQRSGVLPSERLGTTSRRHRPHGLFNIKKLIFQIESDANKFGIET